MLLPTKMSFSLASVRKICEQFNFQSGGGSHTTKPRPLVPRTPPPRPAHCRLPHQVAQSAGTASPLLAHSIWPHPARRVLWCHPPVRVEDNFCQSLCLTVADPDLSLDAPQELDCSSDGHHLGAGLLLNLSPLISDHRWQWVLEAGGVRVSRRLQMGAGLPCGVMEIFRN